MSELFDSILITGCYGMLGHAVDAMLRSHGHQPIGRDVDKLDITSPAALAAAFDELRPTLLINCAAYTKVDACETNQKLVDAINGYAVGELAKQCKRLGTVMVHISTDFVFDGRAIEGKTHRPFRVDDPVHPINYYGQSKLLGETELQKNAPARWLLLRTAWLYGRDGVNFPRTMVQAAQAGKALKVVADQYGSPTYTEDLAAAIYDLLRHGGQGIYHVTNSGQTNWREFAQEALRQWGLHDAVEPLTSAQWAQLRPTSAVRPNYSVLDLSRTEKTIGWPMPEWKEALARYHKAVAERGF